TGRGRRPGDDQRMASPRGRCVTGRRLSCTCGRSCRRASRTAGPCTRRHRSRGSRDHMDDTPRDRAPRTNFLPRIHHRTTRSRSRPRNRSRSRRPRIRRRTIVRGAAARTRATRRRRRCLRGLLLLTLPLLAFLALLLLLAFLAFPLLLLEAFLLLAALLLQAFLLLVVGGLQLLERGPGVLRVLLYIERLVTKILEIRGDERPRHHGVPELGQAIDIEPAHEVIHVLEHALHSGERIGRIPLH